MSNGLPSLTRRLFLRGAAVAAPLAAVPALAAVTEAYAEENPALLALELELAAAEAAMIAAEAAHDEAYRIGRGLWPRAPKAITYKRSPLDRAMERDIRGASYDNAPGVWPSQHFRWEAEAAKRWRKMTPEREEKRRRALEVLALAEKYEADCAHAKAISGYPEASERYEVAGKALNDVVDRINAAPAVTMAGVRIKAQAFRAWEHAPYGQRLFNAQGPKWSANFAHAVLAIMEG